MSRKCYYFLMDQTRKVQLITQHIFDINDFFLIDDINDFQSGLLYHRGLHSVGSMFFGL